jgi:hypothetical protein
VPSTTVIWIDGLALWWDQSGALVAFESPEAPWGVSASGTALVYEAP